MGGAVIVVGSVNVDLVLRVPRLPAPGETVIGGTFSRAHGGKGANQAAAAAALGARTWMVGLVGDDELGRDARVDLQQRGVEIAHLGTGSAPTGVAAIMVDERGENLIAVASGANGELSGGMVEDALAAIPETGAVVLANLEIPDAAVLAAAGTARARGWRFALNPAPAHTLPAELVAACDVLMPNEHEARELGGSIDGLLEAGAAMIAVTRGSAGADLHRPGLPVVHREAFPVRVADTTGAGDAFCGAFAVGMAEGMDPGRVLSLASAAGALATRAVGARASLPDLSELEQLLSRGSHPTPRHAPS